MPMKHAHHLALPVDRGAQRADEGAPMTWSGQCVECAGDVEELGIRTAPPREKPTTPAQRGPHCGHLHQR